MRSLPPETQQYLTDYIWRRYVAPRLRRVQGLGPAEQEAAKQTWTRSFLKQTPQPLPESFGRPEVPEPNRALGFLGTMAHGAESGAANMAGFVGELTGSEALKKAPESYRAATPELTEIAEKYTKEHPPALLGLAGAESLGKMVPSMIAGEAALAPLAGIAAPATRLGRAGLSALRGATAGTAGAPAFTSKPEDVATYGTGLGAVLGGLGGAISRRAAPTVIKGAESGAAPSATAGTAGSDEASVRAVIKSRFPDIDQSKPLTDILKQLPRGTASEVMGEASKAKTDDLVVDKRISKFAEKFGTPTAEQEVAIRKGGVAHQEAIKAAKAAQEESERLAKAVKAERERGIAKEQNKLRRIVKRNLTQIELQRIRKGESATDIAGVAVPTAVTQGSVAAAPKVAPATISSAPAMGTPATGAAGVGAGAQPPTGTAPAASVEKLSTSPAPTPTVPTAISPEVAKQLSVEQPQAPTAVQAIQEILGSVAEEAKQGLSTEVPSDDLSKVIKLRLSEAELVSADAAKLARQRLQQDSVARFEALQRQFDNEEITEAELHRKSTLLLAQHNRVEQAITKGDLRGETLTKLGRPKAGAKAPRLSKTGAAAKDAINKRSESLPLPKAIPKVEDL